jgi:NAD(P)H-hydrate repair Nnr-like enzyme with NAD(P)H-hydrate dehydratase domain
MGESRDEWYGLLSLVRADLQTTEPSREAKIEEWSSLQPEYKQKLTSFAQKFGNATFIIKGEVDLIWDSESVYRVVGGNAGMTKGGTGDALAGMVAGFWTHSPALASVVVGSFLNKQAAHELWLKQGMMYNTTDLINHIPLTWGELQ